MHFQALVVSLLAASPVLALDHHCDTHVPDMPSNGTAKLRRLTPRQQAPAPPTVPLYIHVVAGTDKREDGYLTKEEVDHQVDLIHEAYKPYGITFKHDASMRQWVVNASWAGESRDFNEMKEALRKGDYRSINLYIRNVTVANYGGTCTNPWTQEEHWKTPFPQRLQRDGCVINQITLDKSSHSYMNMGKTAIHEIGHWFGLHHPHEHQGVRNGVNPEDPCWSGNPDDDVLDTPKMKDVPAGQCNYTQNSCPEPAGQLPIYDPVDNYMSYSSDSCITKFTPGQKDRMYNIYDKYRKNETRG